MVKTRFSSRFSYAAQPIWRVLDLINKMQQTASMSDDGGSDARGLVKPGGPRSKQDQRPFLEANSQQRLFIARRDRRWGWCNSLEYLPIM